MSVTPTKRPRSAHDRLSRRQFAKLTAWATVGTSVPCAETAQAEACTVGAFELRAAFPDGFLWGTATSAYQIEGAVNEDGRGPSIWDRFVNQPGKIARASNADLADDHYHLYKDDIQMMRTLGVRAYRFSISWPRVFPNGLGTPNPAGIGFYDRLVDELLANGIEPFATLYHWDLPQTLQDRFGGWLSRDTSRTFADYAGYVVDHLSDRVQNVITINECARLVDLGYGMGIDAPGLKLGPAEQNLVRHNIALGHGLAVQAIRARARALIKVGPAENIVTCVPAIETPENVFAAEIATRELNAGYLTLMLEGKYTDAFLTKEGKHAPPFTLEDLKIISSPVDFIGLNVYKTDHYVVAADDEQRFDLAPFPTSFPRMDVPWLRFGPEAMYWAPRHVTKLWDVKSIYITENGTSATDERAADGNIYDIDRIMFLRNYLMHLQRATSECVPVRGYFLWSLMDNFEWEDGFEKRFGIYHVDFKTLQRTPKLSASFYRETINRNAIA